MTDMVTNVKTKVISNECKPGCCLKAQSLLCSDLNSSEMTQPNHQRNPTQSCNSNIYNEH